MHARAARALLAACIIGGIRAHAVRAQAAVATDSGTIRLHYLAHAIGQEHYTLQHAGDTLVLTDDFHFLDRGGDVRLASTLRLAPDLTPRAMHAHGKTYRFINIASDISVNGGSASVQSLGDSMQVRLPATFFALPGPMPFAAQALLVRYWEMHGRPRHLATIPAQPINDVMIEYRGEDTLRLDRRVLQLRRYSVAGVAWGREALWLDQNGRLAALLTRASLLPFEGIREELAPLLPALQASAIRDRMRDFAQLGRDVPPVAQGSFALVGGRVLDGTDRPPLANATVIIRDGRIAAIGPAGRVAVPAGVRVIDVHGRTIVPGLWDMHTHAGQIEWGPAYLAAGVTTMRDMGGELPFLTAFRDALQEGRGPGPRMLLAGLVDGPGPGAFGDVTAATPEEGRAVVERYHQAGFQQMKLYTLLEPDVVGAIIRRAHELGMTVTGHIPRALTLEAAVDSGMDHVAHQPVRGQAGSPEAQRAIAFLAQHHTVIDPTQSWNELLGHAPETPIASFQPGITGAPWAIVAGYSSVHNNTDSASANARVRNGLAIVKALHDAGVPIVAGTDDGVPGMSLLREIELYVEGGFTPREALQAASSVPATAMRLQQDVGTLEAGKRADLLILDADPLADIHNIRRGHWVIANGRMYECAALWRAAGFNPDAAAPGANGKTR